MYSIYLTTPWDTGSVGNGVLPQCFVWDYHVTKASKTIVLKSVFGSRGNSGEVIEGTTPARFVIGGADFDKVYGELSGAAGETHADEVERKLLHYLIDNAGAAYQGNVA